jgi:microcystin-dependent protein
MEAYLGQIIMFAGTYVPEGWAACDGSTLNITANEALYAVLGTTYGGDGRVTFGLPDMRGRLAVGQGQIKDGTNHVLGQTGGAETVTLTPAQMPAHTHPLNATSNAATTNLPAGNVLATTPTGTFLYFNPPAPTGVTPTITSLGASAITTAGGDQPHANLMPAMGIRFLICTSGLYPSPAQ